MERPDVEAVLEPLKPFQRRTVDHAFERLFVAPDSTARFLVADEVGLGKTLVARGIIARAIDHLWDDVGRIDVIYICSNASIARANLPKLRIGSSSHRSRELATRLTMLATQLVAEDDDGPSLAESKVNFVSFTPGTSFDLGRSTGHSSERQVLYQLLAPHIDSETALMNLMQGGITRTRDWRRRLRNAPVALDPTIEAGFRNALAAEPALLEEAAALIDTWFKRYREHWPDDARWRRNALIGRLRELLAGVCVQALEPDLVIMDEFQRFKQLLDPREESRDPAAELAQRLFNAETPEGNPVRTLLLSATPYKLYTADAEIEHEDHYEDFIATTRFLLGDDERRVQELRQRLASFGAALKRAAIAAPDQVMAAKRAVEETLRSVMARTERVAASEDQDAMVAEPKIEVRLTEADIAQYAAVDALSRALGDRDPMQYWKSAPYLSHFMHGYKLMERLDEARELSPEKVIRVLQEHAAAFLDADALRRWSTLDPCNAKLRELGTDLLDGGLWRLLWMPPTVPYWPLEGAFEGQKSRTKTLLFSAWNVVPDVVSAVLSYEAERRMMGGALDNYLDPAKQQVPLLRLTQSGESARTRHRLLLLLLPCLTLADEAHPLAAPSGMDRRSWVRDRVEALLARPDLPDPDHGEIDERWEWIAPLLLDRGLGDFVRRWQTDAALPRPNPELFGAYADDLLQLDVRALGRRPPHLAELLAEIALGSPAILAARTMIPATLDDDARRGFAVQIADAFWRLFNRPAVIKLLSQLASEEGDARREEQFYWRLVLKYCRQGNLQAVLDEQWHLLWEQHAWSETATPEATAGECAARLAEVVQPAPSRVHARFLTLDGDGRIVPDEIRIRTAFALRFGDIRTDEHSVSQDAVRAAFNSPFRPFVLTSTSIGQEGLDFHPWCHRLVHWNLPGNPVDLEQREGRVHRYKGHAVRRNVAHSKSGEVLASWSFGDDIWEMMFALAAQAAREAGASDLVPHWIAPGKCHVERRVPMLPYTKEVEAFRRLKRQLAAYRVVFGQPRQEELVTLLEQVESDTAQLRSWAVDLSPPSS